MPIDANADAAELEAAATGFLLSALRASFEPFRRYVPDDRFIAKAAAAFASLDPGSIGLRMRDDELMKFAFAPAMAHAGHDDRFDPVVSIPRISQFMDADAVMEIMFHELAHTTRGTPVRPRFGPIGSQREE